MEPLRSDASHADSLHGAEREARIEQLLLAGLDEYFAHRYEHAISSWTRVLFLDRQHDRARAYIERARRAQAERQRESDAVLHQAVSAFDAGDVARARELVTDALDRGASRDDAEGMLERIDRLGATRETPRVSNARRTRPQAARAPLEGLGLDAAAAPHGQPSPVTDARGGSGWAAALLLIAASVGVVAVGVWGLAVPEPAAWSIFATPVPEMTSTPWPSGPLPVARASETHLARARNLAAAGRLYDAMSSLDRIPVGDTLQTEAQRLRADIQRQLLALADMERPRE